MTDLLKEVDIGRVESSFLVSCLSFVTKPVLQALAELYVIDGQYEKAMALYADVSNFSLCV